MCVNLKRRGVFFILSYNQEEIRVHLIFRSQSAMDGLSPLYWDLVNFLIPISWTISIERDLRLERDTPTRPSLKTRNLCFTCTISTVQQVF
jgi:hypothetical protein